MPPPTPKPLETSACLEDVAATIHAHPTQSEAIPEAAMRALGTREIPGEAVLGLMNQLGQPVWRPGSPAGFDDIEDVLHLH